MSGSENFDSPEQLHQRAVSLPATQQVFLEDLTLVIDVLLLVAFATCVHLIRKRVMTVATLAHALSVAFLLLTGGHYIERHVIGGMDGMEFLVRRRAPARMRGGLWFTSWSSAGLVSFAAILTLVSRFWHCSGEGDCVVGSAAPIHYRCKISRLRFFAPVFLTTVVFGYLCITSRMNALLGGSVLHPSGGGYALAVLTSPALLSAICLYGCGSVWLFSVLIEEQANASNKLNSGGNENRLRWRWGDNRVGAEARASSRSLGIQRHPTTTRMAVACNNGGGHSYPRHRSPQDSSPNNAHLRNYGLGPRAHPDQQQPPSQPASLMEGFALYSRSLKHDCSCTNVGVGFGGGVDGGFADGGGASLARRPSLRDRRCGANASEIGANVMPRSPHGQKGAGEGDGWTSSSSSSSSTSSTSSSSSCSPPWKTRRGRGSILRDHHGDFDNVDKIENSSNDHGSSGRSGSGTDSGDAGGGFTDRWNASSLPMSSSPRASFSSTRQGPALTRAVVNKPQAAAAPGTPRLAGVLPPGLPLQLRRSDFLQEPTAPSHSPVPNFPPATTWYPASRRRSSLLTSSSMRGDSRSNSGSGDGGSVTDSSTDDSGGGSGAHGRRRFDTFRRRGHGDASGTRRKTWARESGSGKDLSGRTSSRSSRSGGEEAKDVEMGEVLSSANGDGRLGEAVTAAAAQESRRSPAMNGAAATTSGLDAHSFDNGVNGLRGVGVGFRGETRPSTTNGLLRRRIGWGT